MLDLKQAGTTSCLYYCIWALRSQGALHRTHSIKFIQCQRSPFYVIIVTSFPTSLHGFKSFMKPMILKKSLDQLCCFCKISSVQGAQRISDDWPADWVYTSSGCHTGLILWIDLHAEGKVSSLNEVIVDLNEFQSYINAPCLQMSLLRTTEIWNLKGKDWLASICVINNGLTAAFKSGIAACLVGCLSFNANISSRTCTTSTPLAPTLHCHLLSLCNGSS